MWNHFLLPPTTKLLATIKPFCSNCHFDLLALAAHSKALPPAEPFQPVHDPALVSYIASLPPAERQFICRFAGGVLKHLAEPTMNTILNYDSLVESIKGFIRACHNGTLTTPVIVADTRTGFCVCTKKRAIDSHVVELIRSEFDFGPLHDRGAEMRTELASRYADAVYAELQERFIHLCPSQALTDLHLTIILTS